MRPRTIALALVVLVARVAVADEAPAEAEYQPESPDAVFSEAPDRWVDDVCEMPCADTPCDAASGQPPLPPGLLGDWGGAKAQLAESGVLARVIASQFYQGVANGGASQDAEYGGKVDYFLTFDGGKLGIQEGMQVLFHAETRFGEDVNREAVSLAPANGNMLSPNGDQITAITQLAVIQMVNEDGWAFTFGKYNSIDLFDLIHHTGRGVDGFMNGSMLLNFGGGRTIPIAVLGAGAIKFRGPEVEGALLVLDTNNAATTIGIDDLYDSGASVIGLWKFFHEIGGQPGDITLGGLWSSRVYRSTDPTSFYFAPGSGIVAGEESGSWFLLADAHQTLWQSQCDENRRVEVLSMWSITDGNPNPLDWTMNVGFTAHGMVKSRPMDAMGVGYFYTGLGSNFSTLVNPVLPVRDVQGVELYYKMAVTPWFHLTGDLQFLEPAVKANDTAIVPGLRGVLEF